MRNPGRKYRPTILTHVDSKMEPRMLKGNSVKCVWGLIAIISIITNVSLGFAPPPLRHLREVVGSESFTHSIVDVIYPLNANATTHPAWVLEWPRVDGATFYRLFIIGPSEYTTDVTRFITGEKVFATMVPPVTARPGLHKLRVQAFDASGPLGPPSDPIELRVVKMSPVTIAPNQDMVLDGTFLATDVSVPAGVTIRARQGVSIYSLGSININGSIIGMDGDHHERNGASVSLTSIQGIAISGRLCAGNGASGASQITNADTGEMAYASGIDGGSGGQLLIAAIGGITLGATAICQSGSGGEGGDAAATAGVATPGAAGPNAEAVAGGGGNGGPLSVICTRERFTAIARPGLFVCSDGGNGGDASAKGGRGADGSAGVPETIGGIGIANGGKAGNSGQVNIPTPDFDGNGVVEEAEFNSFVGGAGGVAGTTDSIGGNSGNRFSNFSDDPCAPREGSTPRRFPTPGAPGGDAWCNPTNGGAARVIGRDGTGNGKGESVVATGGAGGNLLRIGFDRNGIGLQWGLAFCTAGDGGIALAIGGKGGPDGGDGGDAEAYGGAGGSGGGAPGPDQYGGKGGDASARGGDGQSNVNCCDPPTIGLAGGQGGVAAAIGGRGGDANNTGGDGGAVSAIGGNGGAGGAGNPGGFGGFGGGAGATPGGGGTGFWRQGAPGLLLLTHDGCNGPPGPTCSTTEPGCSNTNVFEPCTLDFSGGHCECRSGCRIRHDQSIEGGAQMLLTLPACDGRCGLDNTRETTVQGDATASYDASITTIPGGCAPGTASCSATAVDQGEASDDTCRHNVPLLINGGGANTWSPFGFSYGCWQVSASPTGASLQAGQFSANHSLLYREWSEDCAWSYTAEGHGDAQAVGACFIENFRHVVISSGLYLHIETSDVDDCEDGLLEAGNRPSTWVQVSVHEVHINRPANVGVEIRRGIVGIMSDGAIAAIGFFTPQDVTVTGNDLGRDFSGHALMEVKLPSDDFEGASLFARVKVMSRLSGDVNEDKILSVDDEIALWALIQSATSVHDFYYTVNADFNLDGIIDESDAAYYYRAFPQR
ncbi:MAG: hypothetical protein JNG88_09700 [Phycisphaerales bacterium]|nr:hypothetical protein [Phycisphaerales bacterium]